MKECCLSVRFVPYMKPTLAAILFHCSLPGEDYMSKITFNFISSAFFSLSTILYHSFRIPFCKRFKFYFLIVKSYSLIKFIALRYMTLCVPLYKLFSAALYGLLFIYICKSLQCFYDSWIYRTSTYMEQITMLINHSVYFRSHFTFMYSS